MILMSIKPKWCEKIVNGEKTFEIRKTMPKQVEVPFKVFVYCTRPCHFFSVGGGLYFASDDLYVTKHGKVKYGDSLELMTYEEGEYSADNFLNTKVIGEFTCDEIISIKPNGYGYGVESSKYTILEVAEKLCLSVFPDINEYLNCKDGYAWHIKDFKLYDKPKCLTNYYTEKAIKGGLIEQRQLKKAPQSWCYVEEDK